MAHGGLLVLLQSPWHCCCCCCCLMIRRRRSPGRQASDVALAPWLICHRLSCYLNCRRLKQKAGHRSFFSALANCHDAVGALELVDEGGFDDGARKTHWGR